MIYQGQESQNNLVALLQNLRIAIRGLGRVGGLEDLSVLDEVKGNQKRLADKSYESLVSLIMNCVEKSKQQIILRG